MTTTLEPLSLRASLFPLTILPLKNNDLNALTQALDAKIAQAPQFFHAAPIVLDLHSYQDEISPSFVDIKALLDARNLKLIGVATRNELYKTTAFAQGLALMDPKAPPPPQTNPSQNAKNAATSESASTNKLITQSIRSGQQIYAENDLIVLGTVSSGAEIIAGGHIHVYGKLSGRALAGIRQQSEARIFCLEFNAELIAIAGVYQVKEDFDPSKLGQGPTQIHLENNHLKIVRI